MKEANTPCEICSANDWRVIGTKIYRKADSGSEKDYKSSRFRVLFEVWFPGREDVELTYVACKSCGFVVYFPRPTQLDLNAKYAFLDEFRFNYASGNIPHDAPNELRRSSVIFDHLSQRIDFSKIKDVLDYGGNDGRLMQAYLARGLTCYNVDYNKNCIPGVTRLGDTMDDLPNDKKFDLIVCGHVIEHVAEPLLLVKSLVKHLKEGGWLFVEVPMEIWGRPPILKEPVTHINFFTPNSLGNLLQLAGVHVREASLAKYLHPSGNWFHGVRGLAQKSSSVAPNSPPPLREVDVDQYLNPSLIKKFQYYATCPSAFWRRVKRRVGSKS